MANEFERRSREAVHEAAAPRLRRRRRGSPRASAFVFLLNSDGVDLKHVAGGDDEVGDGADVAAAAGGGPVGVEVVVDAGVDGRDSGG